MNSFELAILSDWPAAKWQDWTVLLAVSGGADSVALLRAITAIDGSQTERIVVGHFNHQWRGKESDDDERFVVELAERLGLRCVAGRPEQSDGCPPKSCTEESARDVRYRFLTATADQVGARYVVTAHTADDQVETVVQRVLRGASLAGLAGIPRVRRLSTSATLVRPMLGLHRRHVHDYLKAIGQPFRTDSSNATQAFARNRIRNELLPLARDLYPGADLALLRLSHFAADEQRRLSAEVDALMNQSVRTFGEAGVEVDGGGLAGAELPVIRELLVEVWRAQRWPRQAMGFDEWSALAALLIAPVAGSDGAVAMFPGAVHAQKKGASVLLTRPSRLQNTEDLP